MLARSLPIFLVVACASHGPDPLEGSAPLNASAGAGGVPQAGGSGNVAGVGSSAAGAGAGTAGAATGSAGAAGGAASGGAANGGATSGGATSGGATSGGAAAQGGAQSGGGAGGSSASSGVTPCANNQISQCSGTPLSCHFGGDPGNYEVTLQLGASGQNEVEAEYYRRMLTQSGVSGSGWFSFVTNVRVYEGEPLRPDQDGTTSKGIPGLDVYFRGASPTPSAICYQRLDKPLVLWIEGDSTVTDQESTEYSGWGQHLPQHFVSPISVANYADSGESSASVLASAKLWGAIKAGMKPGDWVMLQIGHNDKDTSAASFEANLRRMLSDVKAAQAQMILLTPISRVGYALEEQHVNSTGANLPQIIRALGQSEGVPVIDLTVKTYDWLQTITWQDYFANGTDRTHTNPRGADVVSGFVRDAVRAQLPALARYLR